MPRRLLTLLAATLVLLATGCTDDDPTAAGPGADRESPEVFADSAEGLGLLEDCRLEPPPGEPTPPSQDVTYGDGVLHLELEVDGVPSCEQWAVGGATAWSAGDAALTLEGLGRASGRLLAGPGRTSLTYDGDELGGEGARCTVEATRLTTAVAAGLVSCTGLRSPDGSPATASGWFEAGRVELLRPVVPFVPRADDDPELEAAALVWRQVGVEDYRTVVTRSCECAEPGPVVTTVDDGQVRSVTAGGRPAAETAGYDVDGLLRLLRRAHAGADRVRVRYDRGVPVRVDVDWDRGVADEETILSVRLVPTG